MATASRPLTKEEFRSLYGGKKPYFEYWFGEAIQKSMPTWLHSVLQRILGDLLVKAGYKSGSEVELRIDPDWEPVPDVIGTSRPITGRYPTEPVEVVIEILSPEDPMSHMLEKCSHYSRIGILATFVVDPDKKIAWFWNAKSEKLERVRSLELPNGNQVDLAEAFAELDKQS
ncbi:MAG: Uma2 family endonuclease [Bryobacteraceae bacterium]